MREWHRDFDVEMTASDAAFYKKFAEDFEYSNRRIHPSNLRKELSEKQEAYMKQHRKLSKK